MSITPNKSSAGEAKGNGNPNCPKCKGKGWIFKGHGEDEQCDCIFIDPPSYEGRLRSDLSHATTRLGEQRAQIDELKDQNDELKKQLRGFNALKKAAEKLIDANEDEIAIIFNQHLESRIGALRNALRQL